MSPTLFHYASIDTQKRGLPAAALVIGNFPVLGNTAIGIGYPCNSLKLGLLIFAGKLSFQRHDSLMEFTLKAQYARIGADPELTPHFVLCVSGIQARSVMRRPGTALPMLAQPASAGVTFYPALA